MRRVSNGQTDWVASVVTLLLAAGVFVVVKVFVSPGANVVLVGLAAGVLASILVRGRQLLGQRLRQRD